MSKKTISLLVLSAILLVGCKNSNTTSNKTPTAENPVTISAKAAATVASSDAKKDTNTNIIVKNKDANTIIKSPALIPVEDIKITDSIKSDVNSIDSVLNSLDEAKELDLN